MKDFSLCARGKFIFFGGGGYETTGWEGGGGSATGVVLSLEIFGFGVWMGFFFSNRSVLDDMAGFWGVFSGFGVNGREGGW